MTALILKAHFDGKNVAIDEAHELQIGTPVTVTVLLPNTTLSKSAWSKAATSGPLSPDEELEYSLKEDEPATHEVLKDKK